MFDDETLTKENYFFLRDDEENGGRLGFLPIVLAFARVVGAWRNGDRCLDGEVDGRWDDWEDDKKEFHMCRAIIKGTDQVTADGRWPLMRLSEVNQIKGLIAKRMDLVGKRLGGRDYGVFPGSAPGSMRMIEEIFGMKLSPETPGGMSASEVVRKVPGSVDNGVIGTQDGKRFLVGGGRELEGEAPLASTGKDANPMVAEIRRKRDLDTVDIGDFGSDIHEKKTKVEPSTVGDRELTSELVVREVV
ncbi:hypothetical protein BJ508DRAFT_417021 [Ascobolus immersus RN42]|uniref:Uncharacterized protein n=1 Tax=Ascobolus immersus RN42 TaxID=1160509 RepID=A0A3N4I0F7_ASCIM|nr:hypothetical protein BJ508DRAFT_417021 [Ascobolus immersus RN42]